MASIDMGGAWFRAWWGGLETGLKMMEEEGDGLAANMRRAMTSGWHVSLNQFHSSGFMGF